MPIRILCIIAGFCTTTRLSGQRAYDSLYVRNFSNRLAIYTHIVASNNDLVFSNLQNTSLSYKPNNTMRLGLGFNYRWLGLSGSLGLNFLSDDRKFGNTETFDLSTNLYSRKYFFDLRYHYTQGHYITNPESYLPGFTDDMPHPQRPDLRIGSIALGGGYVLNGNRFSVPAAFTQTKKQLRRAGSFSDWLRAGTKITFMPASTGLTTTISLLLPTLSKLPLAITM